MTTITAASSKLTYSTNSALARELSQVIDVAISLNRIVGTVITVAQRDSIVFQRAAGFADREARRLAQADTIFRYASLTKPIVSVAALALVEQGKLRLDDPLSKWIPGSWIRSSSSALSCSRTPPQKVCLEFSRSLYATRFIEQSRSEEVKIRRLHRLRRFL